MKKKIILLGATGSIGSSTLRVLRKHQDRLELVGVAAQSRHKELAAICHEFKVTQAVLQNEAAYQEARQAGTFPQDTQLNCGAEALEALATLTEADIVLIAVVGAAGLRPALAAIEAGKDIALANKELLVLGGAHVIEAAQRKGVRLLPTDSEHNAIFQCLQGQPDGQVDKLILTASGGQFRDTPAAELSHITPEMATQHPNWSMGPKITVDSATMANKGLELIEAHWLFSLEPERLEVVIHPQSVVHSFVQFIDGSILAQLSPPSMTFAIQHCLLYPDRAPGVEPTTDFRQAFSLDFNSPDYQKYPCLQLAYEALRAGSGAPAIFNAANEVAVERFLAKKLSYLEIPKLIEHSLCHIQSPTQPSLNQLLQLDAETRAMAQSLRFQ
ncbi:1-deoxy-D-xylulose-5-phosphate reductoisomerase [Coraliomargarita sp. SDUM461004]|uniref:1-deoxy-D-xylulose 5-phosphate reductoisomerase n=1 Tax=Thalassobacterium sedimentorum TaxID=3041258 RepID=A0ABU1AI86_9BACT|nr:1-deoxy-D-xylulose-5-phosphate reductoisomerase [Coraliomargarita sp. SDUM461004]MDQ8193343.1 1-deoxy-D-xylulose-5-phosphate reductoisomerase [Coraliomargarita sp. SDUM461004]